MSQLFIALLARAVNKGLYDDLERELEALARVPDIFIDLELLLILEEICRKFHCGRTGKEPDCEARPRLCELLKELCGVRLPELRLRLNPPTATEEKEESARKAKKPKM